MIVVAAFDPHGVAAAPFVLAAEGRIEPPLTEIQHVLCAQGQAWSRTPAAPDRAGLAALALAARFAYSSAR